MLDVQILLGVYSVDFELLLDEWEELLYRIQPGRILRIEQNIHLEFPGSLEHLWILMNDCVIHQEDHLLGVEILVRSHTSQGMIDEILKERGVEGALNDLAWEDSVLGYGRYEWHRELLPLSGALLDRKLPHFHAIAA